MKNLSILFKKNRLLTLIVCLLMIFSFAILNVGYNSVTNLNNNKDSIPVQEKELQKYVDTKTLNQSISKNYFPSFLLDDERIEYISDSNNGNSAVTELPTISVGYDEKWDTGFFKLLNSEDIILDNNASGNKVKFINLQVDTSSSHYKNSYLQKQIINSNNYEDKQKLQNFYDSLLYEVFQSPDSIFQRNLVYSINKAFELDQKSDDTKVFSDIKDCALKMINPNNQKGENRYWISNNDSENLININRTIDETKGIVTDVNMSNFWNFNKSESLIHGYNGQIGSFQKYLDNDLEKRVVFFGTTVQYFSNLDGKLLDPTNFDNLFFQMEDSNDYRYNDSPDENYYNDVNNDENSKYNNIYYKISSNVSFDSEFLSSYIGYAANKNGLLAENRTEILTYDLLNDYSFKLINGNDINYNNEFNIINKADSLNMENWDYDQVMISPGFFNKNNLKIGDTLSIDNIEVKIAGVATDTYNIYPTVYNNEYISDASKDVIVYCSQALMKKIATTDPDSNNSMNDYIFFGNNENASDSNKQKTIESKIVGFFNTLSNQNIENINDLTKEIGNFKSLNSFYYGYKMIRYFSNVLEIVMFFFALLFFSLSISIFLIIIKEIINSQREVIGILKASGYNFFEITKSYYLFLMITVVPSLIIGFIVSEGLLSLLMGKLSSFFSLVVNVNVSISFCILFFFIFIFVIICAFTILLNKKINVNPLLLINNEAQTKIKNIKVRLNKKSKIVLMRSFYKTSKIQILLLSLISFMSSVITILSTILVIFFYNYNINKFAFYNFNTQTSYNNLVVGNPLNQISELSWDAENNKPNPVDLLQNGLIASNFKTNSDNNIHSISELKNYLSSEDDIVNYLWELIVQGIIFNYQKNISINYLSWIVNNVVGGSEAIPGTKEYMDYRNISEDISNLLASYLPKALGMEAISYEEYPTAASRNQKNLNDAYINVWESILNKIANEKMNSESKVVWKQNNKDVANFNLGFNVTPIEKNANKLTVVSASIENDKNSDSEIFGQKNDSLNSFKLGNLKKLEELNEKSIENQELNVYASKVFASKNSSKNYFANVKYNQLQFLSDSKDGQENWIDFSDYKNNGDASWYYEDENGTLNNFYNNNRIFNQNSLNNLNNNISFVDQNGNSILNTNDIVLKIKKSDIASWSKYDISDFQTQEGGMKNLLDIQNAPTLKTTHGEEVKLIVEDGDYYLIRPYSLAFSSEGSDSNLDLNFKSTWYDAVVNTSENKTISLIRSTEKTKKIKLNIIDTVNDYDSDNFYTDQKSLNKIMGLSSDDSWFNSSTSQISLPPNVIWSYGLTNYNGDSSIKYFSNISKINGSINYIGKQKEIIKKIIAIVVAFGTLIYTMLIILVVTSTVFISRNFIYEFRKTILVLKAIGYSRLRIYSILLTLLLGPMIFGSLLANTLLLSFINLVAKVIVSSLGVIIPIGSGISLVPITLIATILIALLTFWGISKIIDNRKLTEVN